MVSDNSKNSALAEITRLKGLVQETEAALRTQRDVLKQRGFSLPPMAIQAMSTLETDLTALEESITYDQIELGQLRFLADTSARINTTFDLEAVLIQSMDIVIKGQNAGLSSSEIPIRVS
ncbi:MAG TPA: hypothetical protein PLZ51_03675 [Aggregatilineales bacterium]|nr:hypothetical protein [Aggregatilineales bacterium]